MIKVVEVYYLCETKPITETLVRKMLRMILKMAMGLILTENMMIYLF